MTASPQCNTGKWFRRRELLWPTWRAWLLATALVVLVAVLFVKSIYGFLAVNRPVRGGLLVLEGWAADYAFEAAIQEFHSHPYKKLVITGGPLERGAPLSEYQSYANMGAAMLVKLGLSTNEIVALPAPYTPRDRTYRSAITLANWKREHYPEEPVHLFTVGAHARRSWLLFRTALGEDQTAGITAIREKNFDPDRWWTSSSGVRAIVGETLAYTYVRLFFSPKLEAEN